ncbi:unnamed protein product [Dracunculus medinensis]|uniref:Bestrophin homolog n=1 Tax=Dracunculus medinensis TaxID=318479 RepID=A0A0N4U1F6_DRAME|nr:unnamed protein product [Dracunculus medinensis]
MTISYQLDISRTSIISVVKLLFRWKASLWKNVFKELLAWTIVYYIIAFFYRSNLVLNDQQKDKFAIFAKYLNAHLDYIPLTFILGFYVSTIVQRWTIFFNNMGYIERQALFIGNYIRGDDEPTRMMRRAMVRYMCLAQVLVYRDISIRVRKRFPSYESLVIAGINFRYHYHLFLLSSSFF